MEINVKTIIHDDNPYLRTHSSDVNLPLSAEDRELLQAMHQYVIDSQDEEIAKAKNLQPAVGIAAIQLGIAKKLIAVACEDDEGNFLEYALANPKITMKSKKEAALKTGEGCLSVPQGHPGFVYRSHRIKVKGYDALSDQMVTIDVSGYPAIVLQHEIDHLTGKLYYDHIDTANPMTQKENAIILE